MRDFYRAAELARILGVEGQYKNRRFRSQKLENMRIVLLPVQMKEQLPGGGTQYVARWLGEL